jgi:magnesium-transporting ATPase (P-type)
MNWRSPPETRLEKSMPSPAVNEKVSTAGSGANANAAAPTGLTSDEARRRLEKFGPNAMPDASVHSLRRAFEKFWAPVPWMLEAAIVLELALGKSVEASVIAVSVWVIPTNEDLMIAQHTLALICA